MPSYQTVKTQPKISLCLSPPYTHLFTYIYTYSPNRNTNSAIFISVCRFLVDTNCILMTTHITQRLADMSKYQQIFPPPVLCTPGKGLCCPLGARWKVTEYPTRFLLDKGLGITSNLFVWNKDVARLLVCLLLVCCQFKGISCSAFFFSITSSALSNQLFN